MVPHSYTADMLRILFANGEIAEIWLEFNLSSDLGDAFEPTND